MKISFKKLAWFLVSCILAAYSGYTAFQTPGKFVPLIDLVATIISILIGVSLAISAVLSSRPSISENLYATDEEKRRLEKIIKGDDRSLIEGQNIVFWCYYFSLLLAVVFKWFVSEKGIDENILYAACHIKIISAAFAFVATLALLWSATLPTLLRSVSIQRKDLD